VDETPPCKTDPRAPHGFDRNASHSADRYVCECEGWEPPKREWVSLTDEEIKEIVGPWGDAPIKGYTRKLFDQIEAKLREKNHGVWQEWIGLTDEERKQVRSGTGYNQFMTAGEYAEAVQKATEDKLKEKNHG
jgi:hypothetical protein